MQLVHLYAKLRTWQDVGGWWPAYSAFEVMVGAILTQQTTWEAVLPVLNTMRQKGLLDVDELAKCTPPDLEEVVRPTGFYRQKARRLVILAEHVRDEHDSDAEAMLRGDLEQVREELLSIHGIGKETADSILLFGGTRPKFVSASYVARIFQRTGVLNSNDYDEIQAFVESRLPRDANDYKNLYALLVQLAKSHCRPLPRCDGCPLRADCRFNVSRA